MLWNNYDHVKNICFNSNRQIFYRLLNHGTLRENNITDNSKITLIPHLESGLTVSHDISGKILGETCVPKLNKMHKEKFNPVYVQVLLLGR